MGWWKDLTGQDDVNIVNISADVEGDTKKVVDDITPDITFSQDDRDNALAVGTLGLSEITQQEDWDQYGQWVDDFIPDITLSEEDQAAIGSAASIAATAYTGVPIGNPFASKKQQKNTLQAGYNPVITEAPSGGDNKMVLIASAIAGIILIFFITKKKKRK
jgi:hypothetical protein